MKRRNYNRETKDTAKAMYLRGDSFREIASAIGCTHMAVSKWCRDEHWAEYRDGIYADSYELVADKAKDLLSDTMLKHVVASQGLYEKGMEELSQTKAKSAREATYLIETGIKGLMATEQATLPLAFLEELAEIIKAEITDEETLHRIAERCREVGRRYTDPNIIKPIRLDNPEGKN